MKIGIIIVFHNDEKNIASHFFIKHLNNTKNAEICLVNNASTDNTYNTLKAIQELSLTKVSIVDIKKVKSNIAAVRSGARFMFNQFDLNHIGYISKNQDVILNYNIGVIEKREMKPTFFQSVFSITKYLDELMNSNQIINLKY